MLWPVVLADGRSTVGSRQTSVFVAVLYCICMIEYNENDDYEIKRH